MPDGREAPDGWLITNRELFSQRAPGNTCLSAVQSGELGTPEVRLNDSKGCGGVMRAAPAGFLTTYNPGAFTLGVELAAITHSHPTGYLAAGALAVVIASLREGRDLPAAIQSALQELGEHERHEETTAAIERAVELASLGVPTPEDLEELGGGWIAEEALAIALCCALAHEAEPDATTRMRKSLLLAVNHSGDSDSTGAITGNILGTLLGVEAIPEGLVQQLECRALIDQVATDLAVETHWRGVERPASWWKRYPGW